MITLAPPPSILAACPENQEFAIAPLLLAFAADPVARWMYPQAHQYRTFFPRFVRVFGGQAFALGTAHLLMVPIHQKVFLSVGPSYLGLPARLRTRGAN